MKKERKILTAFILNLSFCIFEFIGGAFTGSTAIFSDAVHDLGDALSIGVSFLLERKSAHSKKKEDRERYSRMGGLITSGVLIVGSVAAIINAVVKIFNPSELNYDGMLVFALAGVAVNSAAAIVTHGGGNMNIRAVNLHMLEDVLGWVTVLIGAAVMKLTDFALIDPIMSIGVSLFILVSAVKNIKSGGHSHSHSHGCSCHGDN